MEPPTMGKILLGVTGSVAAVRTPAVASALVASGHEVRVVATEPSLYFFDPSELPAGVPLHRDADEWPGPRYRRDDPVLHIELRKWANLLLIAPLDAQTLAKLSLGLSDNLLTCVFRAWDFSRPVVLAPAMNTLMWESPVTRRHLGQLLFDHAGLEAFPGLDGLLSAFRCEASPIRLVPPQVKRLACGDVGAGGMAEVEAIVSEILACPLPGRPNL
jgi:phosphopantothenoylcysteine decarboxylase